MIEVIVAINLILSVANAIMVAINLLLVNRRAKESLKLSKREQRIKILEKSGLSVHLSATNNKEEIKVTNIGELSIDKLSVDVNVVTETGESLVKRKYVSKDALLKAQELIVPLHSVLKNALKEKELISYIESDMGTQFDPNIGDDVPIIVSAWHTKDEFSLDIVIKTGYEALGEEKAQQDTFKMKYVIDPEFFRDPFIFIDGDNYEIQIEKISGQWQ